MTNWEPPKPTDPTLPPAPPAAAGGPAEVIEKPRRSSLRKIGRYLLIAVGGFVALIVALAIAGVGEDEPLADENALFTSASEQPEPTTASTTDQSTAVPPTTMQVLITAAPTTGAPTAVAVPPMTIVVTLPPAATPSTDPPPPVLATWTIASITDGDTLNVNGLEGTWTVRLIGINSPEAGECFADEATAAIAALTTQELVLMPDTSDTDQFDRKLRYIETTDGVDVGAELVRGGFAIARRYEPDTARAAIYEQLQAEAEAAGVGLWAPDACGPATTGVSIDLDIRYDADGNDNNNLNDEWVRFTNTASAPLDLNGWQVADESASHRYNFRDLTLQPAAAVTLYTGCGTDTDAERYWCNTGSAVWNNSGDTVFLRDPSGNNVIVETYSGN